MAGKLHAYVVEVSLVSEMLGLKGMVSSQESSTTLLIYAEDVDGVRAVLQAIRVSGLMPLDFSDIPTVPQIPALVLSTNKIISCDIISYKRLDGVEI